MSNPTSNFGWQMPTPTDLVTDLPADFEVFGQAVDTSLADLKGGTIGQILSKATNTDMDFVWITNDQGDITAVNVTSPITGGGTSGAVTVGIQSASTSQSGAVQLSDSTSTTSSVLAATPTAVKSAYDLAASAYAPAFTNNFYAGKNKCLNGAFQIAQRGTSITIAASGYALDRINYSVASAVPTGTISQQTFTPGTAPVAGYEGSNYMRVNISANNGCTILNINSVIEDVRTLAGQTATFSFWGKADATSTFAGSFFSQGFGSGGSGTVNTAITFTPTPLTSSWVRYSATISIPSVSGKTIGTGSNCAIILQMPQSGGFLRNGTYDFWGFQLEAGNVATAFQTATGTLQGELAACQRYYLNLARGNGGALGVVSYFNTTSLHLGISYPVEMRTAPTLDQVTGASYFTVYNGGASQTISGSWSVANVTTRSTRLYADSTATTAGQAGFAYASNANSVLALTAEL